MWLSGDRVPRRQGFVTVGLRRTHGRSPAVRSAKEHPETPRGSQQPGREGV
ncbi:hypothetical protein PPTG_24814 [Phytophthora nicotianae INRA-310]|uniref:Uncharacterized protein n=1 Tax=Phytophthora nicotianae (strain INRA-310) TaxID=761204 RepID=W2PAJ9_PHYN3|nr:hypothetical protein PPTG_24814 [Phytophthora nicotianae INRA-310]ETM97831.1 hypothetical protein PPTG_24814 [Phytophthora nicotianae INRA-310]